MYRRSAGGGRKESDHGSIRPNQICAVSLPFTMLSPEQEAAVAVTVYKHLYTPYVLHSQAWSVGEILRAYTEEVFPHLRNLRGKE
ncbi:amylo-alpha-1,6-glucosidase [Paenibacillus sp. TH7-28]